MTKLLINRRTLLKSGIATAIGIPSIVGAATLFSRTLNGRYKEAVVLKGLDLAYPGKLDPTLCYLGPGATIFSQFLKGMLIDYGFSDISCSPICCISSRDPVEQMSMLRLLDSSDMLVLFGDFRYPEDLEQLAHLLGTFRKKERWGVFVVGIFSSDWIRNPNMGVLKLCDGLVGLHISQTQGKNHGPALIQAAHNMLDGLFIHGFIGYDPVDFFSIFRVGKVFLFGLGQGYHNEVGKIDAADRALLSLKRQGVEFSRVCSLHVQVKGDPNMTLTEINDLLIKVTSKFPDSTNINFYATEDEKMRFEIELSLLAAAT